MNKHVRTAQSKQEEKQRHRSNDLVTRVT